MSLSNASISFAVGLIMSDLNNCLEDSEALLNQEIYNDLNVWMEYLGEATEHEKTAIIDEIHERLGYMSVWDYDTDEQQSIINKMSIYFISKYGSEDHVKNFCKLLIDYYKKELKTEFF